MQKTNNNGINWSRLSADCNNKGLNSLTTRTWQKLNMKNNTVCKKIKYNN